MPFYLDKKKLLEASQSVKEEYATSRFGSVFLKLLWKIRWNRKGLSIGSLRSHAQVASRKTIKRIPPSHELIGACIVGSILAAQKLVEVHTADIVRRADSMGKEMNVFKWLEFG